MSQQSPKKTKTLQGLSITLFALTSITPLLVLVMVVKRFDLFQQADISLLVGCTAIVSLLGFFSFLQAVKQLSALADEIIKMQEGKTDALYRPVHKREVHEVAQIRKALSAMMSELKTTPVGLPEEDSFVRDE